MSETPPPRTPSGFFPDPEGTPGLERWWDGKQWTSATRYPTGPTPPPYVAKKNNRGCAISVGVVVLAILVIAGISSVLSGGDDDSDGGGSPAASTAATPERPDDSTALAACRNSVENQLKDPESADFRREEIVATIATGWVVSGEVNANNSFGGKVGFTPYRCEATIAGADRVTAVATIS